MASDTSAGSLPGAMPTTLLLTIFSTRVLMSPLKLKPSEYGLNPFVSASLSAPSTVRPARPRSLSPASRESQPAKASAGWPGSRLSWAPSSGRTTEYG